MLKLLQPRCFANNLFEITPEVLKKVKIKGIIFDLDNTLTEWNNHNITPEVIAWLVGIKEAGIKSCIVSNNSRQRVAVVADMLGIPFVHKAAKPRRSAFRKAMDLMQTKQGNTAVIGDQIFTDILGGNRLGLYTILVCPINSREFIGTKFMRLLEKIVLKKIR